MIHKVLAVYDSKACAYATPFFVANLPIGLRAFHAAVNDNSLLVGKYPDDYTLFELGEWDDSNAVFTANLTPVNLGVGSQFRVPEVELSEPYIAQRAQIAN